MGINQEEDRWRRGEEGVNTGDAGQGQYTCSSNEEVHPM